MYKKKKVLDYTSLVILLKSTAQTVQITPGRIVERANVPILVCIGMLLAKG